MNASELMLGNYLRYKTNFPDKALQGKVVNVVGVDGRVSVRTVDDGKYHESEHPNWLEPIPLTEEILKKNGFKALGYEELVLGTNKYCFVLQKGVDGINAWWWEMFSSPIIPINYVHELQHIFRLLGIEKKIKL